MNKTISLARFMKQLISSLGVFKYMPGKFMSMPEFSTDKWTDRLHCELVASSGMASSSIHFNQGIVPQVRDW